MNNQLSLFRRKIKRIKEKLIRKYEAKGLYENFGQKEYRNLRDHIDSSDYSETGKAMWQELEKFNQWAMGFNGDNPNIGIPGSF